MTVDTATLASAIVSAVLDTIETERAINRAQLERAVAGVLAINKSTTTADRIVDRIGDLIAARNKAFATASDVARPPMNSEWLKSETVHIAPPKDVLSRAPVPLDTTADRIVDLIGTRLDEAFHDYVFSAPAHLNTTAGAGAAVNTGEIRGLEGAGKVQSRSVSGIQKEYLALKALLADSK